MGMAVDVHDRYTMFVLFQLDDGRRVCRCMRIVQIVLLTEAPASMNPILFLHAGLPSLQDLAIAKTLPVLSSGTVSRFVSATTLNSPYHRLGR